MATSFKFKYKPTQYTNVHIDTLTEKELRKEYTRMRDVARKRLINLQKHQDYADSDLAVHYYNGFPKLSEITSPKMLKEEFIDIAWFLKQQKSSVSGIKEIDDENLKFYYALKNKGYLGSLKKKDMKKFSMFVEEINNRHNDLKLDSKQTVEIYEQLRKTASGNERTLITIVNQFDKWYEKQTKMEEEGYKATGNKVEFSSTKVRQGRQRK